MPKEAPQLSEAENKPEEKEELEVGKFDFGGLPDRNLKKNLGCG